MASQFHIHTLHTFIYNARVFNLVWRWYGGVVVGTPWEKAGQSSHTSCSSSCWSRWIFLFSVHTRLMFKSEYLLVYSFAVQMFKTQLYSYDEVTPPHMWENVQVLLLVWLIRISVRWNRIASIAYMYRQSCQRQCNNGCKLMCDGMNF